MVFIEQSLNSEEFSLIEPLSSAIQKFLATTINYKNPISLGSQGDGIFYEGFGKSATWLIVLNPEFTR